MTSFLSASSDQKKESHRHPKNLFSVLNKASRKENEQQGDKLLLCSQRVVKDIKVLKDQMTKTQKE